MPKNTVVPIVIAALLVGLAIGGLVGWNIRPVDREIELAQFELMMHHEPGIAPTDLAPIIAMGNKVKRMHFERKVDACADKQLVDTINGLDPMDSLIVRRACGLYEELYVVFQMNAWHQSPEAIEERCKAQAMHERAVSLMNSESEAMRPR